MFQAGHSIQISIITTSVHGPKAGLFSSQKENKNTAAHLVQIFVSINFGLKSFSISHEIPIIGYIPKYVYNRFILKKNFSYIMISSTTNHAVEFIETQTPMVIQSTIQTIQINIVICQWKPNNSTAKILSSCKLQQGNHMNWHPIPSSYAFEIYRKYKLTKILCGQLETMRGFDVVALCNVGWSTDKTKSMCVWVREREREYPKCQDLWI